MTKETARVVSAVVARTGHGFRIISVRNGTYLVRTIGAA